MSCSIGVPPSVTDIKDATSGRQKLTDPNTVFRPAYESQGYIAFIKDAQARFGNQPGDKHRIEIKMGTGQDTLESSFNTSAAPNMSSFQYWPWISYCVDASSVNQYEGFSTESFASGVSVTLNYDAMAPVPISPASAWYVVPHPNLCNRTSLLLSF